MAWGKEGLPFPTLGIVGKERTVRTEQEVRCVCTLSDFSLWASIWKILGKALGSHIMCALEGLGCL